MGVDLILAKKSEAEAEDSVKAEMEEKRAFERFKHNLKNQGSGEMDLSGSMVVNDAIGRAGNLIGPFSTGFGSYLK